MLSDADYLFDLAPSKAVNKFGKRVTSRRGQQVLYDQDDIVNRLAVAKNQDTLHDQRETKLDSYTASLPPLPPDQQYLYAIETLRSLQESDRSLGRKVNKFLTLAPWLLLPNVGRYIRGNPGRVEEVLCLVLDRGDLDD